MLNKSKKKNTCSRLRPKLYGMLFAALMVGGCNSGSQLDRPFFTFTAPAALPQGGKHFSYQLSPAEVEKLKNGIAQLHRGDSIERIFELLGPPKDDHRIGSVRLFPSREDGTKRFLTYAVRVVDPDRTNEFDQKIRILCYGKSGDLISLYSKVPELAEVGQVRTTSPK
jgi:hypothetical protein